MTATLSDRTPVLIGCGQITDETSPPSSARSPSAFVAEAAALALRDARAAAGTAALARRIDALAVLQFFSESSPRFALPFGRSANAPKSVADRIGADPRRLILTHVGGNVPQALVSEYCERIAAGEMRAGLVCGGELLRSSHLARRADAALDWNEDPGGGEPERFGAEALGWSEVEARQGLRAAIHFYPLIENAIRAAAGRDAAAHLKDMGRLFARFAAVARDNPLATRREGHSAERLATVDADNRFIAFPYPRLMNSSAFVDQSAAVLVASLGTARELGVPADRLVFLHGCAEGADRWHVSERSALHRSAAIRACVAQALDMAGRGLADLDAFDFYSCFPSAVRIALEETGVAEDDPRGLTVTGGLPYFGGPGNNYVTHSIAQMMDTLRRRRDATGRDAAGLVTANGSYVTKHAAGVYSTAPIQGEWRREPPKKLQAELDRLPWIAVDPAPQGPARIETWTVAFDKDRPALGFAIGRMAASGKRFVATVPGGEAVLQRMMDEDWLGRDGTVATDAEGRSAFAAA